MIPLLPADPVTIGDFELLARLGAGGMGQLYLGRRPDGSAAAIKLIRPDLAHQPDFRARFRREITAAGQADGPHTARVIAADPDGDPPWLAVEYIPGPSVAEVVGTYGTLSEESARALMAGLCAGLVHLHGLGLVHRDLKPGNVLITTDGSRIIDFGVSRVLDSSTITQTGQLLGSPGFMSPEQALGTGPVGTPTDVFSLGATMSYALTGVSPFGTVQTPAIVYRVVHQSPGLDDVPEALRDLLADCLAKDPADRPTAQEVLDRLVPGGATAPGRKVDGWLPAPVVADIRRRVAELEAFNAPRREDSGETMLRPRRVAEPAPQAPPRSRRLAMALAGTAVVLMLAAGGTVLALRGDEPGPTRMSGVAEQNVAAQQQAPPSTRPLAKGDADEPSRVATPDVAVPETTRAVAAAAPTRSAKHRPKAADAARTATPGATKQKKTVERQAAAPSLSLTELSRTPAGCQRITIRNPGPVGPDPKQLLEVVSSGGKLLPRMADEAPGATRQVWMECGSGTVVTIRPAAIEESYCLAELSGGAVAIRACDRSAAQVWDHRMRGKDPQGRDHLVLINAATSHVLEIAPGLGGQPKNLRTADEGDFFFRQLFWFYQA